jgi:hypothetical protein
MKHWYLFLAGLLGMNNCVSAQTNPAAFNLSTGTYSFTQWDSTSAAGTYPAHMIFHIDTVREGAVFSARGNYTCGYNLTARARINGRNNRGVSFLQTSNPLSDLCTSTGTTTIKKFMGAAVLSLNTLGRQNIQIGWTGRMLSNLVFIDTGTVGVNAQTRFYSLRLQYRPDTLSAWADVPGATPFLSNSNPTTYKPQGTVEVIPSVTLPSSCNNKAMAQVRWLYAITSGQNGSRPELALDDITVTSSPGTITAEVSPTGPINICAGQSATLTCTTPGCTYLWSNGQGGQSITVTTSGLYSVTITCPGGSAVSSAVQVTVIPLPSANVSALGNTTFCEGGSVQLSAPSGLSYVWSNGANTQTVTIGTSGSYTVSVSNAQGCSATSSAVVVTANPNPTVNAGPDAGICSGAQAQLSAAITPTSGATVVWTPSTGLSNPNIANPVANPTATTTYTVSVNANGCTASDQVVVSVGSLTAGAGSDVVVCPGGSTTLQGSGGTVYSWSPTTGLSDPGSASPVCTPSATNTYTLTVSSGNCSSTASVTVTVANPTAPIITFDGVVLSTTSGLSYQWFLNGAPISGATAQTFTPLANGSYTVSVVDPNSCSSTSTAFEVLTVGWANMQNPSLRLWPNPANEELWLEGHEAGAWLKMFSSAGHLVWESRAERNLVAVPVGPLPAGIYTLWVSGQTKPKRIAVQH